MDEINNQVKEVLRLYGDSMNDKEKFYHILDHIGKHIIKLTRLKENEDWDGHFNEEVADMYLLAKSLVELEDIDDETIKSASDHFLEKVEGIYGNKSNSV